jgi:hypothetical protein
MSRYNCVSLQFLQVTALNRRKSGEAPVILTAAIPTNGSDAISPVLIYSRKIHLSPCYTEVAFAPVSLGRLYMLAYFVGSEILFWPKYWITLTGAN